MTALPLATQSPGELSAYAYSYPHKSSYGPLSPPVPIADAWRDEDVSRLSLYVHVPFCEMRCGFCNLFTQSQPQKDFVDGYLSALSRQMRTVRTAVSEAVFSQFAIGGGTPTFLSAKQLESLLGSVQSVFGQPLTQLPTSIEASPATATPERLQVLSRFGIRRISLGVQSFSQLEAQLFGRPQDPIEVHRAIEAIRSAGRFEMNLDLIYGHPDQTRETWQSSLREALRFRPEELYLYPLYVRPQTGLAKRGLPVLRHRSELYREARDLLTDSGYRQVSLRCFRLPSIGDQVVYACQRDGMIGLGCGARSYTQRLHYATRFAATQSGIRAILRDWITQTDRDFAFATHGFWLSDEEQLRRYVILSLLQAEGLSLAEFVERFPGCDVGDLAGVRDLMDRGWLTSAANRISLTPLGLEHSDEVGPLLYSEPVRERLRAFTAMMGRETLP